MGQGQWLGGGGGLGGKLRGSALYTNKVTMTGIISPPMFVLIVPVQKRWRYCKGHRVHHMSE